MTWWVLEPQRRFNVVEFVTSKEFRTVAYIFGSILFFYSVSTTLVIFNKWLFNTCNDKPEWCSESSDNEPDTPDAVEVVDESDEGCRAWGFPFPLTVTSVHMFTNTIFAFIALKIYGIPRLPFDFETMKKIIPIGIFTGLDIGLSNTGFVCLEASYVEVVKSSVPVFILIFTLAFRLESPPRLTMMAVVILSLGILISSLGEVHFDLTGFIIELSAALSASLRVILAQSLLHKQGTAGHDPARHPLAVLLYMAPVCFVVLFPLSAIFEWRHIAESRAGEDQLWALQTSGIVLVGASIAFLLNSIELLLIKITSALTLCVAGTFKTVLVVTIAWIFFRNPISSLAVAGYAVVFVGVLLYNISKFKRMTDIQDKEYTLVGLGEMRDDGRNMLSLMDSDEDDDPFGLGSDDDDEVELQLASYRSSSTNPLPEDPVYGDRAVL
eukprot:Rmarinus@m.11842